MPDTEAARSNTPIAPTSAFEQARMPSFRDMVTAGMIALAALGGAGTLVTSSGCSQFGDAPGPSENDFGRTVNSISAVIVGIVAQQIAGTSQIDVNIEKPFYADATVKGKTTPGSISTKVDLLTTSAAFTAKGQPGSIVGDVSKSEYDWKVNQIAPNQWTIGRALLKFDHTLTLTIADGKITGTLSKTAAFDWGISGTYDKEGNVNITVDPPMPDPDFVLKGKIKQSE